MRIDLTAQKTATKMKMRKTKMEKTKPEAEPEVMTKAEFEKQTVHGLQKIFRKENPTNTELKLAKLFLFRVGFSKGFSREEKDAEEFINYCHTLRKKENMPADKVKGLAAGRYRAYMSGLRRAAAGNPRWRICPKCGTKVNARKNPCTSCGQEMPLLSPVFPSFSDVSYANKDGKPIPLSPEGLYTTQSYSPSDLTRSKALSAMDIKKLKKKNLKFYPCLEWLKGQDDKGLLDEESKFLLSRIKRDLEHRGQLKHTAEGREELDLWEKKKDEDLRKGGKITTWEKDSPKGR